MGSETSMQNLLKRETEISVMCAFSAALRWRRLTCHASVFLTSVVILFATRENIVSEAFHVSHHKHQLMPNLNHARRIGFHDNLRMRGRLYFTSEQGKENANDAYQIMESMNITETQISTKSQDQTQMISRKRRAVDIALSYKTTLFNPAPFASNPHFQTIGGAILRGMFFKNKQGEGLDFSYWPPVKRTTEISAGNKLIELSSWWDNRVRIDTPDGDFFDVDYKYCKTKTSASGSRQGMVVMVHGLESSSSSPQMIDASMAFLSLGMDVACKFYVCSSVCLYCFSLLESSCPLITDCFGILITPGVNFRSCSGEPNRTPGAYHLGFTDDLKLLLSKMAKEGDTTKVYLVGFSLGANVVLKLLGEIRDSAFVSSNFTDDVV